MARGTPEGALAQYAGLPTGNPGSASPQSSFKSGVQQYLASPFTINNVPYFTPQSYTPNAGYTPTKKGANNETVAPAATASSAAASTAPTGAGQPNINAPVGSYEWWQAYNPGADYSRMMGGGGR